MHLGAVPAMAALCDDNLITQSLDYQSNLQKQRMIEIQKQGLAELRKKLELGPNEKIEFSEPTDYYMTLKAMTLQKINADGSKEELASMDYGLKGNTLTFSIGVKFKYLKKGISLIMAAKAIEELPETTVIESELADTNLHIYFDSMSKKNLTTEEAIKLTPAYKIRERLGYKVDLANSKLPKNRGSSVRLRAVRIDW